jgi:hypothetical protein
MTIIMVIIIPRSRVLLEKQRITQIDRKIPAFYGTRRFITMVTRDFRWILRR